LWDTDGTLVHSGGVAAQAFLDAVASAVCSRGTAARRTCRGRATTRQEPGRRGNLRGRARRPCVGRFPPSARSPGPRADCDIAQAADEAGKALAAGDLDAALAALDAAREQAAQGRRVIKAAASGWRVFARALRALMTNHGRCFVPPTAYRRNAARVAAAVELKYSGGWMKPHSQNLAPSVTARR